MKEAQAEREERIRRKAHGLLTEADLDAISEYLRIAQVHLLEVAKLAETVSSGELVETLRKGAERACDLRERIEAR